MYDVIKPRSMTPRQNREFCQKAKADSLTYEAALKLSQGQTAEAADLAAKAIAICGPEVIVRWLRHYATAKFRACHRTVATFLAELAAKGATA